MKKILFVTTSQDLSVLTPRFPGADILLLGETFVIPKKNYSFVYIRDPFNAYLDEQLLRSQINEIINHYPKAVFLDGIKSYDDVLIEDKWRQYQLLGEFMAPTTLAHQQSGFTKGKIAKKRISSRSRDILFSWETGALSDDWIIQETLDISEEIRVYGSNGIVLPITTIKQPKTKTMKTKVINSRALTEEERVFAQKILEKTAGYSLVGLDIAHTPDGLRLIELNRSPQFLRYNELVGGDLLSNVLEQVMGQKVPPSQTVVGCVETVDIPSLGLNNVVAKVDTGAFSGALHATNITLSKDEKLLSFWPLGEKSKKVSTADFRVRRVKSTHGHSSVRYVIPVTLRIQGVDYQSHVGITSRQSMKFEALIGRRFLRQHSILVNVSLNSQYDEEWERYS